MLSAVSLLLGWFVLLFESLPKMISVWGSPRKYECVILFFLNLTNLVWLPHFPSTVTDRLDQLKWWLLIMWSHFCFIFMITMGLCPWWLKALIAHNEWGINERRSMTQWSINQIMWQLVFPEVLRLCVCEEKNVFNRKSVFVVKSNIFPLLLCLKYCSCCKIIAAVAKQTISPWQQQHKLLNLSCISSSRQRLGWVTNYSVNILKANRSTGTHSACVCLCLLRHQGAINKHRSIQLLEHRRCQIIHLPTFTFCCLWLFYRGFKVNAEHG